MAQHRSSFTRFVWYMVDDPSWRILESMASSSVELAKLHRTECEVGEEVLLHDTQKVASLTWGRHKER